jgi:hypothetical protein
MIDSRAAFTLDRLAIGVRLPDDEQLLIECIDNGRVDCREANSAEHAAISEDVPAHKPETDFMVTLRPGV